MNRTHERNYACGLPHTCYFPYDEDCRVNKMMQGRQNEEDRIKRLSKENGPKKIE